MTRRDRIVVRLLLLLAALAAPLQAAERTHEVRPGESASSIARRYYGSFDPTQLLLEYNQRSDPVIRAGDRLRIPYCEIHRVKSGDSWTALARRYLGRTSAYPILAELNRRPVEKPLQVGETLVMPVVLRHTLRRGETLGVLAKRYYDDPRRSSLLQEFNRLEDPRRLSIGQTVEVPLLDFRLVQPPAEAAAPRKTATATKKPPEEEKPPVGMKEPAEKSSPADPPPVVRKPESSVEPPSPAPARQQPPPPRFTAQMGRATSAWEQGEYARALGLLEGLREAMQRDGTESERSDYWRLLSFVYVAHDQDEEACRAYRALTAMRKAPDLDPDFVSPKIRDTLSGCR